MNDSEHGLYKIRPTRRGIVGEATRQPTSDAAASSQEVVTDGGRRVQTQPAPDEGELTRFKFEILYILADQVDDSDYGLGLKRKLEAYYEEEVNHGRLYPNLDDLAERGLVEKSELDKRTNEYTITDDGKELVRRDAQRRYNIADSLGSGI